MFKRFLILATGVMACSGASPQNAPAPAAEPSPKLAPTAPAPAAPAHAAPATPAPTATPPSTATEPPAQHDVQDVVGPGRKAPAVRPASPPTPAPNPEATAAPAPSEPCGEKGQPDCPLQAWMRRHLDKALDAEDLGQLAVGFTRVADFVPTPEWNSGEQGWASIANSGVAAAKRGDLESAGQTCKTCHRAFRSKYKQSFRLRPVPQ